MFKGSAALALIGCILAATAALAGPPPAEVYGKLPGITDVTLSPSGGRYAFVADDGKARRLFVLTADNKPLMVVTIGPHKLIGISWAGEDHLIAHLSTTVDVGPDFTIAKMELSSATVLNLTTHAGIGVFQNHENVNNDVAGVFGVAEIKGRWYGYFGAQTLEDVRGAIGDKHYTNTDTIGNYMHINTDLYRVDLDTGALHLAARGELGGADWLVGPDGGVVARALYNQSSGGWRVLTGAAGGRALTSGVSKLSGVAIQGLGRGGDSVLVSRMGETGEVIEEVSLSGGPAKVILNGEATDRLIQDRTTGRWIGQVSSGDDPTYTLFSPVDHARVQAALKAFPGYNTRLVSWSDDFGRMVEFTDGKDDSGTYWLVNIAAKSADPIGYPYPKVGAKDVGPVRMIEYKAADGLALHGVLTLPPGREAKNLPLVVMPHGGPWARDYPHFDYWAQAYASRGYAVFQPNFRGSNGYGAKLRDAGRGEWGGKMQTDISDGAAELARQGIVDLKRACIVGWSYGGYAALAGVTLQHGLYRCAVSMAGVTDLPRMYIYLGEEAGLDSAATRFWRVFLGAQSRWRDISPAHLAAKADAPVLLIHGKDDTVVPIEQCDAMERALKSAGKPVERLTLAGADHWLLKEDTRVAMLKASVAFVEKYNPPDPRPASP
ncbi:MAG: peptidase prolyl oligopeptidase [Caulobacteraceae bacterium]|nr:peptidase prolyl oligopeptidase [Caulobacteraceae bacterium]